MQVVEEADQVHKISLPPRLIPSMETAEKLQPQQILPVGSDKRNPQENWGGVKNMIEIGSEALSKEEEDSKRTTSGSVKKRISWFSSIFWHLWHEKYPYLS